MLIGWNYEWGSKHSKNDTSVIELADKIIKEKNKHYYSQFKNDCVILLHDFYFKTEKSLENLSLFIDKLQKNHGCTFRWIDEYPGVSN